MYEACNNEYVIDCPKSINPIL